MAAFSEVDIHEAEQDQGQIVRPRDYYTAEAKIRLEFLLTPDDESMSAVLTAGRCTYKYTITGKARHTTEFALQLEELARRIRK